VFSENDGIGRNISGNHTIGSDDAIIANCYTFQNGNIAVDFNIFPDDDWRCVKFLFVPNVLWFCVKSVVMIIEFATFCDASIVAQLNPVKTIDGNIMAEIYVISENQFTSVSDSDGIMISPNNVFANLKLRIIIQLKSC